MRASLLFLALALPALSDETRLDWSDDTRPMQVPEASPVLAVLAAGVALVLRRNGGAR